MTEERLQTLAAVLDGAALERREVGMLTAEEPSLTLERAYDLQDRVVARRLERGEHVVGMKMGLTSQAKMEQVGVREPIFGVLTSAMAVSDGETIPLGELIHPKAEPEIAFLLGEDLSGPVTPAQALLSVAGVTAALEIIDSRYRDFKFTLPDVVADNTSASRYVVGSSLVPVAGLDLGNLGIVLELNGEVKEIASSAAVLENPARSLAALATMLARRGQSLRKGMIVLSGGATAAIPFAAGDHVRARIEGIGSVEFFGG